MKCEVCGKKINVEEERENFEIETSKSYDNLAKKLCAECAMELIEDEVEGIYFEYCEECGKKYDFIYTENEFKWQHSDDPGAAITGKFLCLDCANEEYEEEISRSREYWSDDCENCEETYSIEDSALAWASRGCDDDGFGDYTAEELEEVLHRKH